MLEMGMFGDIVGSGATPVDLSGISGPVYVWMDY